MKFYELTFNFLFASPPHKEPYENDKQDYNCRNLRSDEDNSGYVTPLSCANFTIVFWLKFNDYDALIAVPPWCSIYLQYI